jgi:hypothetical protein
MVYRGREYHSRGREREFLVGVTHDRRDLEEDDDDVPARRTVVPGKHKANDREMEDGVAGAEAAGAGIDPRSSDRVGGTAGMARGARIDRWADEDDTGSGLAAALGVVEGSRTTHALPAELRRRLEAELGVDLGDVRLHDDDRAHQAAAQLKARAFTIGDDVYFAAGTYDPASAAGIELIAHEVAHVAQHRRGTAPAEGGVSRPGDDHEREAGEFARSFRRNIRYTARPGDDPAMLVEHARREGRRIGLPFQDELEEQLGTSFDFVEAYTGPAAQLACEALGASAFVIRNLVMLADPSPQRELLLHELTHVQQMGERRAPARFALGTLKISHPDDAAEVEARGQRGATVAADPDTIHRTGKTDPSADDPSNQQKRIEYFVANAPFKTDFPTIKDGKKIYAFRNPKTGWRYKQSSPEPWKREDYLKVLTTGPSPRPPPVQSDQAGKDVAAMTSEANKKKYGISNVTKFTWAFVKGGAWVSDVEDIRPGVRTEATPEEQFACYWGVIKALPAKRMSTFEWKGDSETYVDSDQTFTAAEATSYRKAFRAALVDSYKDEEDGGWELFYDEVMKPRLIPPKFNGLTGSIFEELLKKTGGTLDNVRPTFKSTKTKKLRESPRKADNSEGVVLIDAKASESGIIESQARDYFDIIGGRSGKNKIPGWIKGEDENDPKREYDAVLYTVAGKVIGDTVSKQLARWFPNKADREKIGVSPSPEAKAEFMADFNPTLRFRSEEEGLPTYTFTNPPSSIRGVKIKTATFNTSADGTKVAGGSIDMGIDMAGAVKNENIQKPVAPGTKPGLSASVENKFAGFKSTLDKVLASVDVDAKLIDGGIEASIALKAGAAKIPSFEVDEAKLTARYVNGALSVDGEVGLTHKSKKISGKVKVGWDGASWSFDGKATLAEGLVPGLSKVTLGVKYEKGKTKIYCPHAQYQRKFGAIDLTGTVRNLEYDVDSNGFSGEAELDADLGMFGKASATATLEKNDLKSASFSYDSPEFKYPAKGEKPAFKGTVGGTITYTNGKFSGDIRGSANINIPALKAVAGESGVGLAVDAHIGADGGYSGTVKTTTPLKFGKHLEVPSVSCTLEKDGTLSGSFEIKIVNIKYLTQASIKCAVTKNGIEIEEAKLEVPFGNAEKGKFWGTLSAAYSKGKGLQIGGEVNYKIKEGMVATGTLKYSTETHEVSLEMTVSEIKLLDKKVSKTLFKGGKQIPVVNIYGLGIYIDIGLELGFNFGFQLGLKPTVKFEGLSLETWQFKQIAAKMELLGLIYAELVGTPRLGIGVFALDPTILRGGGGLKVPIVGRAEIKPTGTLGVSYSPSGDVSGEAKLGMAMTFGITGSVKPYAEFSVLNDLWNPTWEGEALTSFEILKPKELFNFQIDLAGDMTKKDAPALPEENGAKEPAPVTGDKVLPETKAAPTEQGKGNDKNTKAESSPKEGGDEGPFSLSSLLAKLKGIPGFATAEKIFKIAKKVWDVVKPIYDLVEPLFDLIGKRIEAFMDLFDTELPKSSSDVMPWVWKLAKKVLNIAFGGIVDFAKAILTMLGKAASFTKKLVNKAVTDGWIGVKRHDYYIWRPWPLDNYEFMAAAEYKVNIPGVLDLGHHGPPGVLATPGGAVALGLYQALETVGVPYTYRGMSGIKQPYNDIWRGSGGRG